jgi:hypothetical protein
MKTEMAKTKPEEKTYTQQVTELVEKNDNKALAIIEERKKKDELILKNLREGGEEIYLPPQPMEKIDYGIELNEFFKASITGVKNAFCNDKKREALIKRLFSDMIAGAYQDRFIAYAMSPAQPGSTKAIKNTQDIRHKQDRHLINIIQAFNNLNRQPVSVTIKQADNVTIGDNTNIDKQLNVNSNDLTAKAGLKV